MSIRLDNTPKSAWDTGVKLEQYVPGTEYDERATVPVPGFGGMVPASDIDTHLSQIAEDERLRQHGLHPAHFIRVWSATGPAVSGPLVDCRLDGYIPQYWTVQLQQSSGAGNGTVVITQLGVADIVVVVASGYSRRLVLPGVDTEIILTQTSINSINYIVSALTGWPIEVM